jgi:hypothetical protein
VAFTYRTPVQPRSIELEPESKAKLSQAKETKTADRLQRLIARGKKLTKLTLIVAEGMKVMVKKGKKTK